MEYKTKYGLNLSIVIIFAAISLCCQAQTARKPSFYENKRQQLLIGPNYTDPKGTTRIKTRVDNLPTLSNQESFSKFARIYQEGTVFEIPHVLFVIDRQDNNRLYYLNTPLYQLHETFIQTLLGQQLTKKEIDRNYLSDERRFIFGTLSWQRNIKTFTYEFWEGDNITPPMLSVVQQKLQRSFFAPLTFKTNSVLHETIAQKAEIPFITQEALIKEQPLMVLNTGKARGRLKVMITDDDLMTASQNDIVLLKDVPISLPPVAAVITEKPSTILSHVNLLTKSWGVPNLYLKNAQEVLKPYVNQWISLEVKSDSYSVSQSNSKRPIGVRNHAALILPKPDLKKSVLLPISQLRAKDRKYCGSKTANLGEIKSRLPEVLVPDGFCIPFAQYDRFMKQNGLKAKLQEIINKKAFQRNPTVRKQALAALRKVIISWPVDSSMADGWVKQWQTQLTAQGVFVRSSSNSEDLPNFSGAGLYTTVPNVKNAQGLVTAVKQTWASVFNFEAFEARRVAGLPLDSVMMSVLVQNAVDADSSGVMITADPFDKTRSDITYIVAKRGIGIRVVEGKRIAEQVMYSNWSKAIQVLSQSDDPLQLKLNQSGGVIEVPVKELQRRVLTDELIQQLVDVGASIRWMFSAKVQDIEWASKRDRLIILQARPYLENQ